MSLLCMLGIDYKIVARKLGNLYEISLNKSLSISFCSKIYLKNVDPEAKSWKTTDIDRH